jgi:hypothetical protein
MIGIDDLIGRFTNVMEDEVKLFCDKVLNYYLSEGTKLSLSSSGNYHPLWPITSRDGIFQSSLPEDVVSSVRLFIESVMYDYGSVDDGAPGTQKIAHMKLDIRPKRRGKKNVATVDGSQHSKYRVLQFQGYILGAVASTLVWLRDAISSVIFSANRSRNLQIDRESSSDPSHLLRAKFDCSLMNDCVRILTIHLPSLESDFDRVLSEAVSTGVSLNSSYAAFFELLQQAAQRLAPSIFEVEDCLVILYSLLGPHRYSKNYGFDKFVCEWRLF